MRTDDISNAPQANPGYAAFQMAKALHTAETHENRATRERARHKVARWTEVLEGMANGTLAVGSRTPVEGVPTWATLEVVTGGFATGNLAADGPLLDHEEKRLADFPRVSKKQGREFLNGYYVTEDGLAELQRLLDSGCYEVRVPEEGALLIVAWLARNGHVEEAHAILGELGPWIPRLRFYPVPTEHPRQAGSRVCLQSVSATANSLGRVGPNPQILAQHEAIEVWAPLHDRMVALFLETVEGPPPDLVRDEQGAWHRSPDGKFPVTGGWPCHHYPSDWQERAREALAEFAQQRQWHQLCGRPGKQKGSLAQLRGFLQRCVEAPERLIPCEVGRIRLILARHVAKHGLPGSERHSEARERQQDQIRTPPHYLIAKALATRLGNYPGNSGIEDIAPLLAPIGEAETCRKMPVGTTIPPSLRRKTERCLREAVGVLVERGVITSGDTLARVLPQMTAEIGASGIADPCLRQLHAAIYRAFRQRRSLLLLNLEKQVQLEELPWVQATDGFRRNSLSSRELAKQTLTEVTTLAISAFPHALLPNKLLQEMRSLAKTAELDLPIVEELAADIFMGRFSGKFSEAARVAAEVVDGTLYQSYYGINCQQLRLLPQEKPSPSAWSLWKSIRSQPPQVFASLCETRAGVARQGWDAAVNGMIIEQQQILTTQNLAPLFARLGLREVLAGTLEELPRRCFAWVCKRLQVEVKHWHAGLIQIKNSAYAWRQMVFYLAMLPEPRVADFLAWAEAHLNGQPPAFQERFGPALRGLVVAASGTTLDSPEAKHSAARRFLGWCKGKHWLLESVRERR